MSRSASTAQRPRVIARFLATTAARSAQPTASMQRTVSSDLARDASLPTGTGKVVAPSTRFTATLSYRVIVRMIDLPDKMFWWNAALTRTYGKGNKTWKHRSQKRKRRSILRWREIVHLQVFLRLFQEHLDASLQFLCTKGCIVLRIGIPWSW